MYLPPSFAAKDPGMARELMRSHPFASLISNDDEGVPFVTHLPLHLLEEEGGGLVLLGHVARPNPHAAYLRARPQAVVTFLGPQAYMTPRVYPDLARVPTWNYLAVHATVQAREVSGFGDKDRLLKHLIHDHDPAYAAQWRALDEDFQQRLMQGIAAFEFRVTALQCKIKLNQHRPEAHAAMLAAYDGGNADERALAGWMRRLGLGEAS
ncbi:FMN-binding negative transcriptional regulator [Hydrogenophaga sp.]|uniref:FMN-binding negative transcriptional regulator n=1 Tax=Hydrogenophaga sp. TaxID=1904254 RepID=UPI00262E8528|nr:FMN-binding negative transcriptional regulator [Hydrogenophaga sp.]MCW5654820.1 FMN-binding negative transcriptional regulator [Hydrogenophaga sp.]